MPALLAPAQRRVVVADRRTRATATTSRKPCPAHRASPPPPPPPSTPAATSAHESQRAQPAPAEYRSAPVCDDGGGERRRPDAFVWLGDNLYNDITAAGAPCEPMGMAAHPGCDGVQGGDPDGGGGTGEEAPADAVRDVIAVKVVRSHNNGGDAATRRGRRPPPPRPRARVAREPTHTHTHTHTHTALQTLRPGDFLAEERRRRLVHVRERVDRAVSAR